MTDVTFQNDPYSRTAMRFLLVLQLAALFIVLGLSFLDLFLLALVISFLTLLALVAVILWLYLRFQALPIVRQKRDLTRLVLKFQKTIEAERITIQASIRERDRLFLSEKQEVNMALRALQRNHIEVGLGNASIGEAAIPEVGQKLKERLAGNGIHSAAHVNSTIAELPGFGEAKYQALLGWRSAILAELERTKPRGLPDEQLLPIKQRYQAQHDTNNAAERKAITSEQILEHELMSLKPRLRGLAGITFPGYLSSSLASRGVVALLIAFLVVMMQVVSSVSATLAFGGSP